MQNYKVQKTEDSRLKQFLMQIIFVSCFIFFGMSADPDGTE